MKADRPVNLDLSTFSFPIAAITSILHRISGIMFFVAGAFAVWFLQQSLASPDGFARAMAVADHWLAGLVIWGALSALAYHFVAGIKHLIMDLGIGDTKIGGQKGAVITLVISAVLIVLAGVWVW